MYSYFQLSYRVSTCDFTTIDLFSKLKNEITTQCKTASNQNNESMRVGLRSQLSDFDPCQDHVTLTAFHSLAAFVGSGIRRAAY